MSQIDIDQVIQSSLELSNDLLKGLRQEGYVVTDVSSFIENSSNIFSSFLMSAPSNDFEKYKKALMWSCQSGLALIQGHEKANVSSLNKKDALAVLQIQISNLGDWVKFPSDMVAGAQGRLQLMGKLEEGIIAKATARSKMGP